MPDPIIDQTEVACIFAICTFHPEGPELALLDGLGFNIDIQKTGLCKTEISKRNKGKEQKVF